MANRHRRRAIGTEAFSSTPRSWSKYKLPEDVSSISRKVDATIIESTVTLDRDGLAIHVSLSSSDSPTFEPLSIFG